MLCAFLAGCSNLPRDAQNSTDEIRARGVLTVGVSESPPELADLAAREKQLVEKIAKRLGARIEWKHGNAHVLLEELEQAKLPIVIATLSSDSPFADAVGMSQPYVKQGPKNKSYSIAVAPGENGLLLLVDQIIAEEQRSGN